VLRDGSQALAEAPYRLTSCVGCGLDVPGIADELQAIAHRYVPRKSIYTR
jgi:hypothetical protein